MIEKRQTSLIKKIFIVIISIAVCILASSCHYGITYKCNTVNENADEYNIKDNTGIDPCPQKKILTSDKPSPLEKRHLGSNTDKSDISDIRPGKDQIVKQDEDILEVQGESTDTETSQEDEASGVQQESIEEQEIDPPADQQPQPTQQVSEPPGINGLENTLLNMINHIRVSEGLSPLNLNQSLISVARHRALDMIERDYFSHVTPDGKSIYDVLADFGISYQGSGENIQYCSPPGWKPVEDFVSTWMSSTGHRENILNAGYNQVGIGVVDGNNKRVAVVIFLN